MQIHVLASGSSGNCYIISDGETPALLECGIRIQDIRRGLSRRGMSLTDMAGCLVSHEHNDHARSIAHVARAGVDVYATAGTFGAIGGDDHHRYVPIAIKERFRLGSWTVLPFDTVHDAAEPAGFVMESQDVRFLYLTDTSYSPYLFADLTHIMIEANYSAEILKRNVEDGAIHPSHQRRVYRNHMSIERVGEFLKANDLSRLREVHLIHLSYQNSDEQAFKDAIAGITGVPVYVH